MELSDKEFRALSSAMTKGLESHKDKLMELQERMRDLEQRGAHVPQSSDGGAGTGELYKFIAESDGFRAFAAGSTPSFELKIPTRMVVRNEIKNPNPLTNDNPLVSPDRVRGIAFSPPQRLTIRALFTQLPTSSNLIEVPTESTYTNSARPQGDVSPVGHGEGELKAESDMTFTLASFPIVTIAHWIRASRQIIFDAPLLQAHLENRLLYGLALEEEQEMLTGTGAAGEINGINNQASSFTGGVTNANAIDTLARAANQLAVANYEPNGYILHPTDWLAIKLLKDSNNNYLLGNPQEAKAPMLHGLAVIPTVSQTLGRFTCIDARRWGYIADREDANVRMSENVSEDFIRNMVRLLAETRTTLVTEQASAGVYGLLSHAG